MVLTTRPTRSVLLIVFLLFTNALVPVARCSPTRRATRTKYRPSSAVQQKRVAGDAGKGPDFFMVTLQPNVNLRRHLEWLSEVFVKNGGAACPGLTQPPQPQPPQPGPPAPAPEPNPAPEPTPGTPMPEPNPAPEPTPGAPEPVPEPTPGTPEPEPVPEPTSGVPAPEPAPEPTPGVPPPAPMPAPVPVPAPAPTDPLPGSDAYFLDLPALDEKDPDFGGGTIATLNVPVDAGVSAEGATVTTTFGVGYAAYLPNGLNLFIAAHPDVLDVSFDPAGEIAVLSQDREDDNDGETVGELALPTSTNSGPAPLVTQANAPWPLARMSYRKLPSGANATNFIYNGTAGLGVYIHVIDTGVNVAHTEFGGRAQAQWAAKGFPKTDQNGHGTHVAALAAGVTYGAAKRATVLSYTVTDKGGTAIGSDWVAGAFQSVKFARAHNGSHVINSSITFRGQNVAIQKMVEMAHRRGMHVVAAAGNGNGAPASSVMPAGANTVIAVGATMKNDMRAAFSNGGNVNVWSDGYGVTSAGYKSVTATAILSGTSMAAPIVAGEVAVQLSIVGPQTPDAIVDWLSRSATKNVIKGLAAGDTDALLFNCWSERGNVSTAPCWDFVNRTQPVASKEFVTQSLLFNVIQDK